MTLNRRQFLERSGRTAAAAALAAQPAWLAACGSATRSGASSRDWQNLAQMLQGRLLTPGEPRYATVGLPYNKLYSSIRPRGIAACRSPEDAQVALSWARETGEEFTVMSGAHSYAGYSTCRGLVINLSGLNALRFDSSSGRVMLGVGARNHQMFSGLPPHGVGLPHGRCPVTGVGGFVLGGGFGFTSRTMGMLSDTLVSTDIITASGDRLTCDATSHPDLYWACRGGAGGSFGINTSYTLQTHPLPPTVSVYKIEWPWSEAHSAIKALQAMMLSAPNQLGCRIGMGATGLSHKTYEMNTLGEYAGPVSHLRQLLSPVLAAAKPRSVTIEELPLSRAVWFLAANVPFDRFASKSSYAVDAFPDEALATLVRGIEQIPGSTNPGGSGIAIFCLGGAVNSVAADATAYVHRNARFLINYEITWEARDSPGLVSELQGWLQSIFRSLQPNVLPSSYQNWPDSSLTDWQSAYYGSNLKRLTEVKAKYDPKDVFKYAQSVPLAA